MTRNSTGEKVFQIIVQLQKDSPHESLRPNRVYKSVLAKLKKDLSYRQLMRIFRKLLNDDKVVRPSRGQYWLPDYLERNIEHLKRELAFEKKVSEGVVYFSNQEIAQLEQRLIDRELQDEKMMEHEEMFEKPRKKGLR